MHYPVVQEFKLKTCDYTELIPVFPELLKTFLKTSMNMPSESEVFDLLVRLNMRDLEKNKKPEGYNRGVKEQSVRLIFPIVDSGKNIEMLLLYPLNSVRKNRYLMEHELGRILYSAGISYEVDTVTDYFKKKYPVQKT